VNIGPLSGPLDAYLTLAIGGGINRRYWKPLTFLNLRRGEFTCEGNYSTRNSSGTEPIKTTQRDLQTETCPHIIAFRSVRLSTNDSGRTRVCIQLTSPVYFVEPDPFHVIVLSYAFRALSRFLRHGRNGVDLRSPRGISLALRFPGPRLLASLPPVPLRGQRTPVLEQPAAARHSPSFDRFTPTRFGTGPYRGWNSVPSTSIRTQETQQGKTSTVPSWVIPPPHA